MHINPPETTTQTAKITLSPGATRRIKLWSDVAAPVFLWASFQVRSRDTLIKSTTHCFRTLFSLSETFGCLERTCLLTHCILSSKSAVHPAVAPLSFHWPDTKHTLRKPLKIPVDSVLRQPLPHLRDGMFPMTATHPFFDLETAWAHQQNINKEKGKQKKENGLRKQSGTRKRSGGWKWMEWR